MATPPIENGNRFAVTFLEYKKVADAIPDELMLDKTTGKIYYKTPEGAIIDVIEKNAVEALQGELTSLRDTMNQMIEDVYEYIDNRVVVSSTEPTNQTEGSLFFRTQEG